MRLFFTRHGETNWNVESRMQGWKESDLTDRGILQARELSSRLKNIDIDLIYSSTLNRALKTAEIIRDGRNIEIIPCEELKEIRLGPWEGFTLNEIKERYPKEYELFFAKPELFECEGCETFFEVKERVLKCIERIISEKKECKNILIVAHAVVIRIALVYFENRGMDSIWKGEIPHAGLFIVEVSDNERKVIDDEVSDEMF